MLSDLKTHQRSHTGEKTYQCTKCDSCFSGPSALKVHITTHSEKPYQCTKCDRSFSSSSCLKNYEKINTGEKHSVVENVKKGFHKQVP